MCGSMSDSLSTPLSTALCPYCPAKLVPAHLRKERKEGRKEEKRKKTHFLMVDESPEATASRLCPCRSSVDTIFHIGAQQGTQLQRPEAERRSATRRRAPLHASRRRHRRGAHYANSRACTHARTHARTHTCMHARTHAQSTSMPAASTPATVSSGVGK